MSESSWKAPTLITHGDVEAITAKRPGNNDDSELGDNTASLDA